MNVSTKRASIGLASTMVAAGLIVGGVVSTSDAATTTKTVSIKSMFQGYSPRTLTVKAGTKVTWKNTDSSMLHTVSSDPKFKSPAKIASPSLSFQKTFSYRFTKLGVYHYRCNIHTNMTGTVTVVK